MLCLLTCTAYGVTLSIDTMCTKVLCCDECVVMSWFTLVLMLFMSFMVAVPVSHLRASPMRGNKLHLQQVLCCDFPSKKVFVFIRLIADMIVGLQELYMASVFESSTCSVDISWVSADGCWFRNCSSWCVLISCLLNDFQLHSRCPKETCVVIIHEWCVGYVFRTGWNRTNYPNSLPDEVVVRVIMNRVL